MEGLKDIFLSNIEFYLISGGIIFLLIFILVFKKVRVNRKENKESVTDAIIDQMSMRRTSINTTYIEKEFFQIIQSLVYGYYAQAVDSIPVNDMVHILYMKWYERLKREYELGVKRQVYSFVLKNAKVVKQDNSSMYAVTRIEIEAEFVIDYLYSHVTMEERRIKTFKQRFVFLNTNDSWLLENAHNERDITEKEVSIDSASSGSM